MTTGHSRTFIAALADSAGTMLAQAEAAGCGDAQRPRQAERPRGIGPTGGKLSFEMPAGDTVELQQVAAPRRLELHARWLSATPIAQRPR
ncbi:hypothetical protein [Sphingopyxis sp.]|uniref:hypothetical protein n=1 Tax=Sphingopyxis sp. TaxID=1908224 RepID=UPI0025F3E315|nr:hypothetical protein [Sphingopyxis sp.]MBK6413885.1 hypothetical protein [Sphingopyxis sp.]